MLEVNDMLFFIGIVIWIVFANNSLRKEIDSLLEFLTNLGIMLVGAGSNV